MKRNIQVMLGAEPEDPVEHTYTEIADAFAR